MLNLNRACQTCHKWSEDELKARILTIQERRFNLRNRAMDAGGTLNGDLNWPRETDGTTARSRQLSN